MRGKYEKRVFWLPFIAFSFIIVALLFFYLCRQSDTKLFAAEGDNSPGLIGNPLSGAGSLFSNSGVPEAPKPPLASAIRFVEAKSNQLGGIALDDQGAVWAWGYNAYGMLGFYDNAGGYAGGMRRISYFLENGKKIESIEAGYHTNYAIDTDGVVYAWGYGLEGQMGSNHTDTNNPTPKPVTSLSGKKIVSLYASIFVSSPYSCVYAIADDGKVYAWGYADGSRIPGVSGYVRNAVEVPSLSALNIKQMDYGDQHGIILTEDGKVYTWGVGTNGRLGHGNTTPYATPREVGFFSGMNVKQVSANYRSSLVLVENSDGSNTVYQFGAIFKSASATNIDTPEAVIFDLNSSTYDYDSAPNIKSVTCGAYVSYAIDEFGHLWSWGHNLYYSFGTDGGLQNKLNTSKAQATQQPLTMGDGDTQGTTTAAFPKGPVFSGRSSAPSITYYAAYGQWTSLTDGLHPTIYDKKYMETVGSFSRTSASGLPQQAQTHENVFPVDKDGRKLVYLVRRDSDRTYSGNFYVANENYTGKWIITSPVTGALPTGLNGETGVPKIKDEEESWISLTVDLDTFDYTGNNLKEVPYMASISTLQSSSLFLDTNGNLYKTGYDGSGAVAWGWDYGEYEFNTAGNNKNYGLYNMYTYELMFMRGAPRVSPTTVKVKGPLKKIYKSDRTPVPDPQPDPPIDPMSAQEQHASVEVILGTATVNAQLHITIEPELKSAKYVIIPYDNANPISMLKTTGEVTKAEFEAAYNAAEAADKGDLIELNQAKGDWTVLKNKDTENRFPLVDNDNVIVRDNCVLWVYTETKGYSNVPLELVSVQRYDNYYSDTTLYHNGKHINDPKEEIYSPSTNYVKKMNDDGIPDKYGIPLDKDGAIIDHVTPAFGYDKVQVRSYDQVELDVKETNPAAKCEEYWSLIHYWYQIVSDKFVDHTLNDLKYEESKKYTDTFNYERKLSGWVTITYKGRFIGDTTDADNFLNYNMKYEAPNNAGNTFLPDDPADLDFTYLYKEVVKKVVSSAETISRKPAQYLGKDPTEEDKINGQPAHFTWSEDSHATDKPLSSGNMIILPINVSNINEGSTMEVIVYYNLAEMFIRQLIQNPNDEIVTPTKGFFGLLNRNNTEFGDNYNVITASGKESDQTTIPYTHVQLTTASDKKQFQINPIIPQLHKYVGYRISNTQAANPASTLDTGTAVANYATGSTYYVTVYLEPTITNAKDVPFYNWDYKLNQFGKILAAP